MKKILLFLFLGSMYPLFGQEAAYVVNYKVGKYGAEKKDSLSPKEAKFEPMLSKMDHALKQIDCELYFNQYSSMYKIKDKVAAEEDAMSYNVASAIAGVGAGKVYYKNVETKTKLQQQESMGETFIINYPFEQYTWQISSDTKVIDGYQCYKATTYFEEYDHRRNKKLTFNPFVWFTPDLPFPFGPVGLDGLPGLVLEGSINGKMYFYATEIKMIDKKSKPFLLRMPEKGKKVTPEEFSKIIAPKD